MRSRASDIACGLLVLANLGVIGLIVWGMRSGDDGAQVTPVPVEISRPAPPPQPPPPRIEKRPIERQVVARAPVPVRVRVTITATRGNCWISARKGKETGSVLAEKTLLEGDTVTVRARRVWLELGAAGNVEVSVNGRPQPIRSGTTNIVLG